jgi:hypothetical protein
MTQLRAESTKAQRHELNIEILKKTRGERNNWEKNKKIKIEPISPSYTHKRRKQRSSVHIELGFVNISNGPYSRRRMQLKREMFDLNYCSPRQTHKQMA